ncbi:helix-turn-helix transcriptional regulator [Capillimicrobium parvum]|uniref:HTH luxR-type domain-containing protein n=1 Tax=Capillimicrobium parvum TaxID=2884022 RepID=A0A9E7BZY6_9ACTN|nr:helix-turn-helix transcriptional regulator [Capillimicrobium parvum]UGS35069.1 hypothetical protein DSM104329_01453 [Capillimicrobium parvum]
MLSRVAAVLSSGASTRERVLDLFSELRHVLPFEAAMLAYVHPLTGQQQALLSLGYSERVASRLVSAEFRSDFIDRFDMMSTRWPLRERDLPVDPLTVPSIAEYLTPSGLVEGIVAPLVDGSGRYQGCLFCSTSDKRHPSDDARTIIGHLAPALVKLVDPSETLRRLASTLDESWSAVGISADGACVPVGLGTGTPSLDPDGPLMRAVAARIAEGDVAGHRFLWPSDDARRWRQVVVLPCCLDAAGHGSCYGTVLALREIQPPRDLTRREIEVLSALVEGESNAVIAAKLHVAPRTVKAHVEHILEKLEVPTRAAAAVYAVEEGLVLLPAVDG